MDTLETDCPARVWRFLTEEDAQRRARTLDGYWNNVQGPIRSFALGATPSWVVIAWNPR